MGRIHVQILNCAPGPKRITVRFGVNRVVLAMRRPLPLNLDKLTTSEPVGTSHLGQKLTKMPTGSPLRAVVVFQLPTDSVAGILPLGCEYVAVAILGQRADVGHQPVGTRNGELVGDRAIEDLPSRFDSHLRILIDSKLPLGIC
jgi:hypothetical protein